MNQNLWALFPFLFPLLSALLLSAISYWPRLQYVLSFFLMSTQLAGALWILFLVDQKNYLVTHLSGWPAPFAITLAIDLFSALMLAISALVSFAVVLYSKEVVEKISANRFYYPLIFFLMVGVNGAFIAGDLFNMYVCFEIMLISSFSLLTFSQDKKNYVGMFKYMTMSLMASLFFLMAAGLIYGTTGALNFAHLSLKFSQIAYQTPSVLVALTLLLISFGIKSAAFPLYHWLPAAYPKAISPLAALFAGLLTKVGIYAMIRIGVVMAPSQFVFYQNIILTVAGFTMLTGVFAAATQYYMKRILSYHIISQVGYMIMGFALLTQSALAATSYYLIHHILAKANLFFIQGIIEKKSGTDNLLKQGGILRQYPRLAVLFLVSAMALAGLPPFSGFFAKFLVIQNSFGTGHWVVAIVALFTGLATLYSMTKIWNETFLKTAPTGNKTKSVPVPFMYAAVTLLATLTILMGVGFPWLYPLFEKAGTQLMRPDLYIQAVLGKG